MKFLTGPLHEVRKLQARHCKIRKLFSIDFLLTRLRIMTTILIIPSPLLSCGDINSPKSNPDSHISKSHSIQKGAKLSLKDKIEMILDACNTSMNYRVLNKN